MKTRITEVLGIKYPIVQGGMTDKPFGVNLTILPTIKGERCTDDLNSGLDNYVVD